jgi:hypothetical protein
MPPNMAKGRLRNAGLILEHPMLRAAQESGSGDIPLVYLDESEWSELKKTRATSDYHDPFKADSTSVESNRYLAAAEPVHMKRADSAIEKGGSEWEDTGLLVVVQDDYATEVAPAVELERKLVRWTLLALALAAALVAGFWLVVSRGLIDAPRSRLAAFLRRRSGMTLRPTMDTSTASRSHTALSTAASQHQRQSELPDARQD